MLTRAELVAYYAQRSGRPVDGSLFYEVFGLFRLAVISQQVYYRFAHGQTTNPAFRDLRQAVLVLNERARRLTGA